ncbi:hypothetical protein ABT093_09795 [Kitasatospora sp. NPDC002551]|uniref:hypothetical protein n=1 Tax=Kitasatospora sp. NPDC002551 TaxID=3154539 RepID=UPI00331D1DF9
MGLWSKRTSQTTSSTTLVGRTPAERRRRERDIRVIDKGTAAWLRSGGPVHRRDR